MIRWCQINFFIQLAMIGIAILSLPFSYFFLAILMLIPFGGWQVISSIVFAMRYDKIEKRFRSMFKIYWIGLGFLSLFYSINLLALINIRDTEVVFITASILLGIYYFILSARMTKNRTVQKTSFLPNILDQF